jgi:tol-pal system protein YbgF
VAEALMRRIDEMEYQLRELTGETERLNYENRQLRQQVEALEAQLAPPQPQETPLDDEAVAWMRDGLDEVDGSRIAIVDPNDPHAEARAAATGVLGAPNGMRAAEAGEMAPAVEADPAGLFDQAHAKLLDGDFGGAQVGFETFVNEHPDHARAGEAWYWLGETFFVRSDFAEAADAYIASLRSRPDGEKAPDALVRLAASLNGMGRQADACATLDRFSGQFPNAPAASRARANRESLRAGCR